MLLYGKREQARQCVTLSIFFRQNRLEVSISLVGEDEIDWLVDNPPEEVAAAVSLSALIVDVSNELVIVTALVSE